MMQVCPSPLNAALRERVSSTQRGGAHLVAEGDPPVRVCAVSLRAPHLAEHH